MTNSSLNMEGALKRLGLMHRTKWGLHGSPVKRGDGRWERERERMARGWERERERVGEGESSPARLHLLDKHCKRVPELSAHRQRSLSRLADSLHVRRSKHAIGRRRESTKERQKRTTRTLSISGWLKRLPRRPACAGWGCSLTGMMAPVALTSPRNVASIMATPLLCRRATTSWAKLA